MANEVERENPGQELQTREKQTVEREGTRPGVVFSPDVDIIERGDEFLVTADLPGVDEKHVDIRLDRGILTIDAHLAWNPEPAWTPVHTEYRLGNYHREFRVSEEIDGAKISAHMRDGVLELHLPKAERHRPRQIAVQAG